MPVADRTGRIGIGRMATRTGSNRVRNAILKYLNRVPRRSLWGWTRRRGKGRRMGQDREPRTGKGRGLGHGRCRGKGMMPDLVAASPPPIDEKKVSASKTRPLSASPSDKDQQLEALKAQSRASEQELRTLSEKISRMHGYRRRSSRVAVVDTERCIGCGACAAVCPMDAITVNAVAHIEAANCAGCGACIGACSQQAITLKGE